jgi:hypothetical protein
MTSLSKPTPASTLAQAKEWLREQLMPGGKFSTNAEKCPCCNRQAKIYKRKVHAQMARGLIRFYTAGGARDFMHAPTVVPNYQNTDFARLTHWGLVEEQQGRQDDGNRPGYYRITDQGVAFIRHRAMIDKYLFIYADRVWGREGKIGIRACLGTKFNYDDLMEGR